MNKFKINDKEIILKRVKVKQVRVLVKELASKVKEVFDFMDNAAEVEDVKSTVTSLVLDNIDYIGDLVIRFTENFTIEEFEDLDVIELVELLKKMLTHNGIKGEMIKSFFQNYSGTVKDQVEESFTKPIPIPVSN